MEFFDYIHPSTKCEYNLTRVIQVLILHECVLPERKNGAHHRARTCVLVMTPKQAIHQSWMSGDIENSQDGANMEASPERQRRIPMLRP